MNLLRLVSPGAYRPVCAITSSIRFHVRVWPTSPSARAIDSRSVFGTVGPNPVSLAIKFTRPARFISGAELVDNTKLAATLLAAGDARGNGDGEIPPLGTLGGSSRLIVLVRAPTIASGC